MRAQLFPLLLLSFAATYAAELPLMPLPARVSQGAGSLPITGSFSISTAGAGANDPRVQMAVQRTFERLSHQTGIPILPHVVASGGLLNIVVESRDHRAPQRLGDDERYSLEIAPSGARLSADEPIGVLRGLETFLQLVQENTDGNPGFSATAVTIRDEPRFPWRGLSLDVSRHFIPLPEVKRTLDGLAGVKLNVLHWHLSDDQGFRVESKKYPRLQRNGSDGMFYSQSEIRDVIAYARDRGIRIVPEFDMPGHATSWLPGYPNLGSRSGTFQITRGAGILSDLIDPTKESTYRFLDGFVGEMAKLFPDNYFHIGGDEVDPKQWMENAPIRKFMRKHHIQDGAQLQVYFNQRLLKIVTKHGKRMEGWDEVLQPSLPKDIVIQSWRGQKSLWQAARDGYPGILSAGYYLDLMYPASYHYSVDPMKVPPPAPGKEEDVSKIGTFDLTPDQQKHILGGEAAMWEELCSPQNLDSRLWPRLAAIAERLWSPESVTDVNSMYARLDRVNLWLEFVGLRQRSNLHLMRERLMNSADTRQLDMLASILEPVKGYSRHAERYNITTPLNRLVDSVAPESDAARNFNLQVDAYISGPKDAEHSAALRTQLQAWADNAAAIRPVLQSHSLLNEDIPVADLTVALCKAGLAALNNQKVEPVDAKRQADLLVQIAPGIQKLTSANQQ